MATEVIFEAGTIADAMKKAGKVAPKSGSKLDMAAGIILDVDPANTDAPCVVRATDTETFYMESLAVASATGDAVRWRLPSQILANVVGTVPVSAGTVVKFTQATGKNQIVISCNRLRSTLNLILNDGYPEWDALDEVDLYPSKDFGSALTKVEWAAAKGGPGSLAGVYLDGEFAIATDRYRVACTPCPVELPGGPVVIPAGSIGALLKPTGEVLVGMHEQLFVAQPDEYTQIKTVVFGGAYAPVGRIMSLEYDEQVRIRKADLLDRISKAENFAGSDRSPILNLYFGKNELAVHMTNDEIGIFGDVIELPGQAEHKRCLIKLTPKVIQGALSNAPGEMVTINYNTSATNKPIRIDGSEEFRCWMAPRSDITPSGGS